MPRNVFITDVDVREVEDVAVEGWASTPFEEERESEPLVRSDISQLVAMEVLV